MREPCCWAVELSSLFPVPASLSSEHFLLGEGVAPAQTTRRKDLNISLPRAGQVVTVFKGLPSYLTETGFDPDGQAVSFTCRSTSLLLPILPSALGDAGSEDSPVQCF